MTLEAVDVRLEIVAMSHFDGKKVVIALLGLPTEAYFVRNISITCPKLWSECGVRSRANLRPHLSGWMGKLVT